MGELIILNTSYQSKFLCSRAGKGNNARDCAVNFQGMMQWFLWHSHAQEEESAALTLNAEKGRWQNWSKETNL
jgi:hypothetical protein